MRGSGRLYNPRRMTLDHFLRDAVVLLAASTAVVLISHKLKIPSVVGFLLTGVLIGPSALGLVSDTEQVEIFAEVGVVFLLFTIGLEFSPERLKHIRRAFFLGGSLQAVATILLGWLLATAAGLPFAQALFCGMLLALSSTAVVLKLYADRRELEAPQGKVAIGILLFQDFLLVPMIVLTPVLAGAAPASFLSVALRFLGALAAVALVFLAARYLMPRLLHQLVRTGIREILLFGALLACLGLAWLTSMLDFSLALGAFLAGIVISESDYSHQVVAEVAPFRDVFNSVFFVSIGMLLDVPFALAHPLAIAAVAVAVVVVKSLAAGGAVALLGFPVRTAILVGLGLAQVGEFSFVLLKVGQGLDFLPAGLEQNLIAASVLTLVAAPVLVAAAPRLAELVQRATRATAPAADAALARQPLSGHVIVVGFGTNGRNLARVLKETRIPYRVIELSGELASRARRAGEPVIFGDATRREILEQASIETARMVVFAISDFTAVEGSVRFSRQLNPDLYILVRTRAVHEIDALRQAGANEVIAEEFETSIEIFTRVLERFHVPRNIIAAQIRLLRGGDYRLLRSGTLGGELPQELLAVLTGGLTEVYRLGAASAAAGRTIRELGLRTKTGATIIAVVRDEQAQTNPSPDLTLATGDSLVLVGSHAEVERAFALLERGRPELPAQG